MINVEVLEDRNYFFVRTDGGYLYDVFLNKSMIALGYNAITLDLWNKSPIEYIKSQLRNYYDSDNHLTTKEKTKRGSTAFASGAYNKIKQFIDLKKGDVIVIPSEKTNYISIGIINSERPYEEPSNDDCEYLKRRSVKWLKVNVPTSAPTSPFKFMKTNQHGISKLERNLISHVDQELYSLYLKGENLIHTISIESKSDVSFNSLRKLLDDIYTTLNLINEAAEIGENLEEITVKISIQSPGKIITSAVKNYKSVAIFALLLLNGCDSRVFNEENSIQISEAATDSLLSNEHLLNNVDEIRQLIETAGSIQ